jgi:hypothetical protein
MPTFSLVPRDNDISRRNHLGKGAIRLRDNKGAIYRLDENRTRADAHRTEADLHAAGPSSIRFGIDHVSIARAFDDRAQSLGMMAEDHDYVDEFSQKTRCK